MDEKEPSDLLNNASLIEGDLTRSNMGSSSDSEKIIQRLNDELREAQELANTEKHKCLELRGILEEERKDNKQQADESVTHIKRLQGQLWQLQDEMGVLREQLDLSSSSHGELQSACDEAKALRLALEVATAERDADVAALQANLSAASKDLDKWRQTANTYEREIDNVQHNLQQQSKQWVKTAEIQASQLQSLQLECAVLQSEKQDLVDMHQMERSSLQAECASLVADKEELLKTHRREKEILQSECVALRSEREAVLQMRNELEREFASSRALNVELSDSVTALERSQQELEKRMVALQQRHQQESAKLRTQLDEADGRSETTQREYEGTKKELSDLWEKYETTSQEKESLTGELGACKENMKELQEKGTRTSQLLPVQAVVIGLILALLYWCFGAIWS